MSNRTRVNTLTSAGAVTLNVIDCANCGVIFAITDDYSNRRRSDGAGFRCPNGHTLSYGKDDTERLKESTARETHLKDQLQSAIRDAEASRVAHLRDRSRIANGVCPCCNRHFANLHGHMTTQHPDYAAPPTKGTLRFECSCGSRFTTFRGLRTHQGHVRPDDWAKPGKDKWSAHLTEGVKA
jgi:hypothetical protein